MTSRGFRRKCGPSKAYGESDPRERRSLFEAVAFGFRPQPRGLHALPERDRLKLSRSLVNMPSWLTAKKRPAARMQRASNSDWRGTPS